MTEANTVGQCLWMRDEPTGPFITDAIAGLRRWRSVVLTYGTPVGERLTLPLYAPYSRRSPWLPRTINRVCRRAFGVPLTFAWAARRHRIRLLHAHFGYCAIEFLDVKQRTGLPLITSFHGYDVAVYPRQEANYRQLQALFANGDHFTAISEHLRKDLLALGCPSDRLSILRVGVDLNHFHFRRRGYDGGPYRLLTVVRFVEKKGIPYLIRAVARVRERLPQIELRVVGDGGATAIRSEVEQLIAELGLNGTVKLVGFVPYPEIVAEFDRAHVFVLPSVTASNGDKEGIPHVLFQAQAMGLPVVATHHAGIPEGVLDGESGYLVPERDVEALANRIVRLLESPENWYKMGMAGRAIVERDYNLERQIQKQESLYDEVLNGATER